MEVKYGEQTVELPLVVVNAEGPSLFGCDWMTEIKLDWKKICTVTNTMSLTKLLDCHSSLFEPGLGKLKRLHKAEIQVDSQAKLKFYIAHLVPCAMKNKN